jgi:hypothetical protein
MINAYKILVGKPERKRPLGRHRNWWEDNSGRRITLSLSYITERGEGKIERARGGKTEKSLSEHVYYN